MTSKEMAKIIYNTLDSKSAVDIKLLEVKDLTALTDFFIIATGTSNTHLKTLVDYIETAMEKAGETPHHIEGRTDGTWTLLDYSCVVIHLFTGETRQFYSIERLWADAKQWSADEL